MQERKIRPLYEFEISNNQLKFNKMKKVVNISLASSSFSIDEDAYARLEEYLGNFRRKLTEGPSAIPSTQVKEVMEDLEERMAELFAAEVGSSARVVTLPMVEKISAQLGMPDGSPEPGRGASSFRGASSSDEPSTPRKLYRSKEDGKIAGVCFGLGQYFDIDVALIRIIFLVLLFGAGSGLLAYLILWIAIPVAETPAQKCEMFRIPPTAENMARFSKKASK